MARTRALSDPITFTLDGEPVEAERGEPLAAALVAADKLTVARSPKFHRPRAPACMRGACDGCLARVDGAPNTMTCLVAAAEGMTVVSQNRLGPRDVDLLRMTDWFFPDGMNHHELFAGVPGIQTIMQGFAWRVAGLGRLPNEPAAPRPAARRSADVVVVGAGPSGMAAALALAAAGRQVEVLDDQLAAGGGVIALAPEDAARFEAIRAPFAKAAASGEIRLRTSTTAGAIYGRDLLVVAPEGIEVVESRALVLACGAHDGAVAFEGNDVPGVMSARAAGFLLARGVLVADRIAVVVPAHGGPFGESFARAAAGFAEVELVHGDPVAVRGSSRAKAVRVRPTGGQRERKVEAGAVLVDGPRSPAYELCQQAGATVAHEARGFVVRPGEGGRITDGIWATGEVVGVPFDPELLAADAARVAAAIQSSTK